MKAKNPFLEWALYYARERHWRVFPLAPRQKVPRKGSRGLLEATTDEKQIERWWKETPNANIGVRTGDEVFVIDEDPRHGGDQTRAWLVGQHGALADTLRATTPNDGAHRFYQMPAATMIPTRAPVREDWPGIDVRGAGGYVAVHPSEVKNDRGELRRYEWDGVDGEWEMVNPADGWLIDAILGRGGAAPAGNGAGPVELPERLQEGRRDATIFRMACAFRRARAEYADVVERLIEYDQKHCAPPLGAKLVTAKVKSAWRYPAGDGTDEVLEAPAALAPQPRPLTSDELLDADIPAPEELVEGLLPRRGVALVVGAQRSGKTIFAAQTAIALVRNQHLFGHYALKAHGPVVVFEKDDPAGDATFKDIFVKSQLPRGLPFRLYPKDRIPAGMSLGDAFTQWIEREVRETGAVLVVLDSYTALRGRRKNGGDISKDDNEEVGQLDELGKRLNCLLLLIHHESTTTRANSALDWDARVAGSYGLTAACECQIRVSRYLELPLGATERLLRFRSRHLKDHQATLAYNAETGLFEHVLDGAGAPLYPILRELKRAGLERTFKAKDLEEPLGISRATAFRHLSALRTAGLVYRVPQQEGVYELSREMDLLQLPWTV